MLCNDFMYGEHFFTYMYIYIILMYSKVYVGPIRLAAFNIDSNKIQWKSTNYFWT